MCILITFAIIAGVINQYWRPLGKINEYEAEEPMHSCIHQKHTASEYLSKERTYAARHKGSLFYFAKLIINTDLDVNPRSQVPRVVNDRRGLFW